MTSVYHICRRARREDIRRSMSLWAQDRVLYDADVWAGLPALLEDLMARPAVLCPRRVAPRWRAAPARRHDIPAARLYRREPHRSFHVAECGLPRGPVRPESISVAPGDRGTERSRRTPPAELLREYSG